MSAAARAAGRELSADGTFGGTPRSVAFNVQGFRIAVNPQTGEIRILKSVHAADAGRVINPMQCRGQIEGGVAQSLGATLYEELLIDGTGRAINPTFRDYHVPAFADIPRTEVYFAETSDAVGPYGAKSMSESPYNPVAAALGNALRDATGIRFDTVPFKADRVLLKLAGLDKSNTAAGRMTLAARPRRDAILRSVLEARVMNERVQAAIRDLVVANRILGNEGVVDAFGHISIRHPENAGRYFLACSRSPGLVTEDDIVEFDLDSNRLDGTSRAIYAERFIHGCLYKARPDVMSVCHSHAHAVVPFTVTNTPIEPIWVMASGSGSDIPNWDIRDEFPNEGTMLVVNDATGRSLAKTLGAGRVCLLRGHGAVIATSELKATVMVSIGLMCNAAMLIQAHTLSQGRGDAAVKHLSPAEIEATSKILLGPLGLDRAWEYWRVRAGFPAKEE